MEITLHKYQERILSSKAKYILAAAGLQSGKTTIGAIKLLKESEEHLDQWIKMGYPADKVPTYMVVAQNENALDTVTFAKLTQYLEPGTYTYRKNKRTLQMHDIWDEEGKFWTGRIFIGRSAHDPNSLVSITANGIWADEAGLYKRAAWRELRPRIESRENYCHTFIVFTTTPNGHNWLYDDIYLRSLEEDKAVLEGRLKVEDKLFEVVQWRSVDNTDGFSKKAFEREKNLLSEEEFQSRYCGSFTRLSGLVYPRFNPIYHITDNLPEDYDLIVGGLDFSELNGTKAGVIMGLKADKWYLIEEYERSGIMYEKMADDILKLQEDFKVSRWYSDPEDRIGIQTLRKMGVKGIRFAEKDIVEGVEKVRRAIASNNFVIYRKCLKAIKELSIYHYKNDLEGAWDELKPVKWNDHLCDCIRYVINTHHIRPLDNTNEIKVSLYLKREQEIADFREKMLTPKYLEDPSLWKVDRSEEESFYNSWNFDNDQIDQY